jgi:Tfp pilus assembly protein PilF
VPAPAPPRPAAETPKPAAAPPPPAKPAAKPAAAPSGEADAHKAEVEALTTAALDYFVQNEYSKARKAVDKALALDPKNKKAKELLKILGVLS